MEFCYEDDVDVIIIVVVFCFRLSLLSAVGNTYPTVCVSEHCFCNFIFFLLLSFFFVISKMSTILFANLGGPRFVYFSMSF